MIRVKARAAAALFLIALLGLSPAQAEMRPTLSFSGVPGVIDMPSGEAMADGTLSIAVAGFGPQMRTTLSFQITPRISGSYRFTTTRNWNDAVAPGGLLDDGYDSYQDRSFDLRFLVLRESDYAPSVTIGLQDFIGTGLFSAEYIAATKSFSDRLKVTAGLGWGRLGSYGDIGSFGTRPEIVTTTGGTPTTGQWFRGPIAPFAGAEWKVNDRWTVKAEYSSDNYAIEDGIRGTFDRKSPFNFGVEYQRGETARFGIYSLYGSEIGLGFNLVFNPKQRAGGGGIGGSAPKAVGVRPQRSADPAAYDGGWVAQPDGAEVLYGNLAKRLAVDGMTIEHLSYSATTVQLRIRNDQIDAGPQAIGRAARALSQVMPPSVEVFQIIPVVRGMGASQITIRRSDLEALEHAPGNDAGLRSVVQIGDSGPVPAGGIASQGFYPKFAWGVAPAFRISQPSVGDVGLRFSASYELRPGLILSGTVYQRVADNLDQFEVRARNESNFLQNVRSDVHEYNTDAGTSVDRLTLAWYAKPADNVYSRVTFGYIERMHAGVSGELLWKPATSRLALGAELNYSMQRDTDGGFGVSEYDYGVATGYVSAYYDLGNGFLGQLDVGRYLAGDTGATVTIDREFGNGVKVGAFATFTSVSATEFGEGSFDKGIRLTIPLNWVLGQPDRREFSAILRPVQRDGGARLDVEGRLYEPIRDYHLGRLDSQWGRTWQ